ncbi:hypothetical protein HID58_020917 [Brassica napus]|uniref:Uncharacterized protein n=1 Tax=Brassica napus TaxID=3708 RepID=A0ABQ8CV39_BRANA|nr:hypothetical protein HID58_020917 [Brassica napus]
MIRPPLSTRVAILSLEGTRVARSARHHRNTVTPEICPTDHQAKPELHRSVTLHLQPSLGHLSRRASIAMARSHPSSLTAEHHKRNRMHLNPFRRNSSFSSSELFVNRVWDPKNAQEYLGRAQTTIVIPRALISQTVIGHAKIIFLDIMQVVSVTPKRSFSSSQSQLNQDEQVNSSGYQAIPIKADMVVTKDEP